MARTIAWLPTTSAASPTIAGILSPSSPTIAGILSSSSPTTSSPSSLDAAVSTSTASSPAYGHAGARLSPPPAAASPSSSSSPDTAVSSSGTVSSDTPSPRSVLRLVLSVMSLANFHQVVAEYSDTRDVAIRVTLVDRLDTVFQFISLLQLCHPLGWSFDGNGLERLEDLRRVADALRGLDYLMTEAIVNDLAFTELDVECIRNELKELGEPESLGDVIHNMVVKVNDVLIIGRALTQWEEDNELSALKALVVCEESCAAKVLAEQEDGSDHDLHAHKALAEADPGDLDEICTGLKGLADLGELDDKEKPDVPSALKDTILEVVQDIRRILSSPVEP